MNKTRQKKYQKKLKLDRSLYDQADVSHTRFSAGHGLSEEVVREISRQKNEPAWLLKKRLQGLELFLKTPLPSWGPDLSGLDLNIVL